MINIDDFVSHVKKNGLQRKNRFQVTLTLPQKLIDSMKNSYDYSSTNLPKDVTNSQSLADANNIPRILSIMATNVTTPGVTVAASKMNVGTSRNIAYDKSTGEFDMSFRCSGDMMEKKLFDAWIKLIFRSDHTVAYYDDYVAPSIEVVALDYNDNVTYQTKINEAYPSVITPLNFDRDEADTVLDFQVTFFYRKNFTDDNEDYTRKSIAPLEFGLNVNVPEATNVVSVSNLPAPPVKSNWPLFVMDVIKNIQRVQREIENGGLGSQQGQRLILNIIRDVTAASGTSSPELQAALDWANSIAMILGRK